MAMGRPKKRTADYFPHYVAESRTKEILENSWENDGYAFWFKLLELLCKSDGHYYDCSSIVNYKYLTVYMRVSEETADLIIQTLVELGKLDRELWENKKILWCQSLVDNLAALYSKRTVPLPQRPVLQDIASNKIPLPTERKPEDKEIKNKAKERNKKSQKKKETPLKKEYAEFVSMTEEEHQMLLDKYGEEKTAKMIEVLDNYKGQSGKKYKSDYRAILNWVVERVNESYAKKGSNYSGLNANRQNYSGRSNDIPSGQFKPSGGFRE